MEPPRLEVGSIATGSAMTAAAACGAR